MRVYLSGGMEYAADEGIGWRTEMQRWLQSQCGHSVFNPNEESDRFFLEKYPDVNFRELKEKDIQKYIKIAELLVEIDSREIAVRSDFVICYWDDSAQRGAGTKGELTMAKYFSKPVYMVTAMPLAEIPGWVLGCTTKFFGSFEELKNWINTA